MMTINSIKNRVNRLSKSKPKGIHVFVIDEIADSQERKADINKQIEALKKQGEDPLLITIRTMTGPDDLKKDIREGQQNSS